MTAPDDTDWPGLTNSAEPARGLSDTNSVWGASRWSARSAEPYANGGGFVPSAGGWASGCGGRGSPEFPDGEPRRGRGRGRGQVLISPIPWEGGTILLLENPKTLRLAGETAPQLRQYCGRRRAGQARRHRAGQRWRQQLVGCLHHARSVSRR